MYSPYVSLFTRRDEKEKARIRGLSAREAKQLRENSRSSGHYFFVIIISLSETPK
jgi:hypothetical protein